MPEPGNYFAWLGLAPGVYSERQLSDRLAEVRRDRGDDGPLVEAALAYCLLRDPQRQAQCFRWVADRQPERSAPAGAADPEIETAFSAAVTSLLEGDTGVLRYSNRRRLLDLAARMGLVPFEANLLIERARFRATQRPAWNINLKSAVMTSPTKPRLTRWLVAVGLALAMDLVALLFLLR